MTEEDDIEYREFKARDLVTGRRSRENPLNRKKLSKWELDEIFLDYE